MCPTITGLIQYRISGADKNGPGGSGSHDLQLRSRFLRHLFQCKKVALDYLTDMRLENHKKVYVKEVKDL